MDENSRYAVGLDVGTSMVRAVAAGLTPQGELNVIGYAETPNSGMRKGTVANLTGPSSAINRALADIERMSGKTIRSATMSINGAQIVSTRVEGMIVVDAGVREINERDLARVEEVAIQGRIPANQEILEVIPLQYILDGQGNIKNPLGMTGSRLEMKAVVVSTLTPNFENLHKAAEAAAETITERVIPSAMGSGRAVLSERQMENGVAVVDIGAATTGVAIYEEGDLQYIGVVPLGSNNITNDLAVMLAIDTEVAEDIKRRFATGNFGATENPVILRWRGKELHFERSQIDQVVKDRLEEIFDLVRKEIRKAHYDQRLPEGIVLTGGGAKMRDIDKFVREMLNVSVKVGVPLGMNGVAEVLRKPEYAAAVGLMQMSAEYVPSQHTSGKHKKSKKAKGSGGVIGRFFKSFKV